MSNEINKARDNYITIAEKTDEKYHRRSVIIHSGFFHLAEFDTEKQLKYFADLLGFTYAEVTSEEAFWGGKVRTYKMSHQFVRPLIQHNGFWGEYFWNLEQLPTDVLPIPLLSNGSIVTGYYLTDDNEKTITIYRPNPNAANVYKPLSIDRQITFMKKYGTF